MLRKLLLKALGPGLAGKLRTLAALNPLRMRRELDALYALVYDLAHDQENPLPLAAAQTRDAFAHQWSDLQEGAALLSDPWFKANVAGLIADEELQLKREWFPGKKVLDAGCGNGRWSYGLTQLGCDVTCVDVNASALAATLKALAGTGQPKASHQVPLEEAGNVLAPASFDLVWCWGVAHHTQSYTRTLATLTSLVKPGGVIYLYLYGRESIPYDQDVAMFRERVRYHTLKNPDDRFQFLLKKAGGDPNRVHNVHDIYAPLINRRLTFEEVRESLAAAGFTGITRTMAHTEVFVRAVKGDAAGLDPWVLPPKAPPYWFMRYS